MCSTAWHSQNGFPSKLCWKTVHVLNMREIATSRLAFALHIARMLSCVSLCDPVDCSLPCSSVHGIFQATIVEWVAISFSRGSSQHRDRTHVSCIGRQILYHWATWEAINPYIFVAIRYNSNRKIIQRSCFSLDWAAAIPKELSKQDDMITLKRLISWHTHIRC